MFGRKKTRLSITATGIIKEPEQNSEPEPIRKIIDGKLYDTSKAKLVGEAKGALFEDIYPNYKGTYTESIFGEDSGIYKTNGGEFFIVYRDDIVLITEDSVKSQLSFDIEAYTKLFGQPEEA